MRPMVIDAAALRQDVPRRRYERAWWQQATDEEFREELERMSQDERENLLTEVNAAKGSTGTVMSDANADPAWRQRARKAMTGILQKHSILVRIVRSHQTANYLNQAVERDRIVAEVRAMAIEGDVQGGLLRLLDWVQTFGSEKRGRLAARTDGKSAPTGSADT